MIKKEAKQCGIPESQFYALKKQFRQGKPLKLHSKTLMRLSRLDLGDIMTYKDGFESKRKKDGTYYVPKRKTEDGTEYVPAEYQNVDKRCKCKKPRYCTRYPGLRHKVHICFKCGRIMASCKASYQQMRPD